jgi:hypothetical protein
VESSIQVSSGHTLVVPVVCSCSYLIVYVVLITRRKIICLELRAYASYLLEVQILARSNLRFYVACGVSSRHTKVGLLDG